ncbi:LysR family transcriptional regulator ArgP [Amphritea balenae]|uniref:LysR family transcriptional regulator ArgP n=1 Tax=Amphritea balenae TaxID=452629 RepID=A0A3P1SUA9_9GAMM|nr:LysR family transcriptional regulator ArgP [Amphritea balenae]RRD00525.1 LysR family transcriptional regulator ArgP [Amphritea balenae]GGK70002.1 LysR family transcriptional regulator [Amphritea balenae]
MLDHRQLQAFATVIELQSFDKAAQRLFLTQSAISQRVKQLEESLGQLLIIRSQPLRPTSAGQQLMRHYRQLVLLQNELLTGLSDAATQGYTKLAIGLNADSLATWFLAAMEPLFQQQSILLELRVDDQDQTHHLLRQGEVIGCISASDKPVQGGNCVPLGTSRYLALASQEYINRYFATGINKHSLEQAPVVEFNEKDELQDRFLSTYYPDVDDYPRHRIPSSEGFTELICRGHAWGMVPEMQVSELLKNGEIQQLNSCQYLEIPLYWHSWNLASDIGQKLTRQLVNFCQTHLDQPAI